MIAGSAPCCLQLTDSVPGFFVRRGHGGLRCTGRTSIVKERIRGDPGLTAVADANRRWQAMIRSGAFPSGSDRHRLILGAPEAAFLRRFGALSGAVTQWSLPLWPDLHFETIAVPGGPVLQEWLVRPDPATRPDLGAVADARPWSCVIADLDHAFGPVRHADGDTSSRWSIVLTAAGGRGVPRCHLARFAWGLLQAVTLL